jgi:uncharacterized protein YdaU (DUF1376 family)
MADTQDTTSGKAPAFQFYAKDFDTGTRALSTEEVGAYIRLLCHQWDKGSIPTSVDRLSMIAGLTVQRMRRVWQQVAEFFIPGDTQGTLINPRLERERTKQAEYRRRQSDHGKRGGRPKGSDNPTPKATPNPTPKPDESQTKALLSPVFGLQTSVEKNQERVLEPFESVTPELPKDSVEDRAGEFVTRYRALYLRLRKVHYLGKPSVDFDEARQLVAVFDDPLLDKLAFVWLNTDHRFAEDGTRTVAKFRSMATWCQERLNEWEAQHGPLEVAS